MYTDAGGCALLIHYLNHFYLHVFQDLEHSAKIFWKLECIVWKQSLERLLFKKQNVQKILLLEKPLFLNIL